MIKCSRRTVTPRRGVHGWQGTVESLRASGSDRTPAGSLRPPDSDRTSSRPGPEGHRVRLSPSRRGKSLPGSECRVSNAAAAGAWSYFGEQLHDSYMS
eukprot:761631-Hanusia_phi.AAC.1